MYICTLVRKGRQCLEQTRKAVERQAVSCSYRVVMSADMVNGRSSSSSNNNNNKNNKGSSATTRRCPVIDGLQLYNVWSNCSSNRSNSVACSLPRNRYPALVCATWLHDANPSRIPCSRKPEISHIGYVELHDCKDYCNYFIKNVNLPSRFHYELASCRYMLRHNTGFHH